MRKCGHPRSQICNFVEEGLTFCGKGCTFYINYSFDCDSARVIYLIICKKYSKFYVGSTITSFKKRFSNHKSSAKTYDRGRGVYPGNICIPVFVRQSMREL